MVISVDEFCVGNDIIVRYDVPKTVLPFKFKIKMIENHVIYLETKDNADYKIDLNSMTLINITKSIAYLLYSIKRIGVKDKKICNSIYIPWIHKNTTIEFIKQNLDNLNWGKIYKIDLIPREDSHNIAFIHYFSVNEVFSKIDEHISKGNEIKITYNDPHFWIIKSAKFKEYDEYFADSLVVEFGDSDSDSDSDDEDYDIINQCDCECDCV